MKKRLTKLIALLLTGAMIFTAAGCGNSGSKEDTTGSANENNVESGEKTETDVVPITFPLEEPIEITALNMDFNRDRTQYADELYEKYTNVKIDWTIEPSSDLFTVVNLNTKTEQIT